MRCPVLRQEAGRGDSGTLGKRKGPTRRSLMSSHVIAFQATQSVRTKLEIEVDDESGPG